MLWERVKLALVVVIFIGILFFTSRAQTDILEQSDPKVLNFLAGGYCPGLVMPGGQKPLEVLGRLTGEWEAKVANEYLPQGRVGFQRPWRVRFLEMPSIGDARGSWAMTRLMGGQAPEFMTAMTTPEFIDTCNKWYVDLSPYLNRPNPYVPGNKRWIDIFYPDSLSRWRATSDRHLYCIPIDQVEIGIFYNKDIFKKCGIDEAELKDITWDRFLDIQRRIKDAGEVPFLMPAGDNMRVGWMRDIINDMLYAGIYNTLNTIDDPDLAGTSSLDAQEKVRALRKGLVNFDDERYWECWRLIKEWSQYWQAGYLGTTDNILFRQGKAAMTVDGSWSVKNLEIDDQRTFQYGVFFIPKITPATSKFSTNSPARGVGGSTATQFSLTRETAQQKKNAVEACVDLLMYITAPKNIGPLVAEGQSFLPTVHGAALAENLKFMQPVLEAGCVRCTGFDDIDVRGRNEWWSNMQLFLDNRLTREQAVANIKKAVEVSVQESMAKYKDQWKWIPDANGQPTWEIVPPVSKLTDAERSNVVTPATATGDPASLPSSAPASSPSPTEIRQ